MNIWHRAAIGSVVNSIGQITGGPVVAAGLTALVDDYLCDHFEYGKKSIDSLGDNEKTELMCVISCMEKLAIIDGIISRQEIEMVDYILKENCCLKQEAVDKFFQIFDAIAKDDKSLSYYADSYRKLVDEDYNKCMELALFLVSLAHIDGEYSQVEENSIKEVISVLHLPSHSYEQVLFQHKFEDFKQDIDIDKYGTGFFINDCGYLVTNYHVINGSNNVKVRSLHDFFDADLIMVNEKEDLCVLYTNCPSKGVYISTDKVQLGQQILTYGYPEPNTQGFAPKMTQGIISSISGCKDDGRYFQFDALIHPGNSGGPLIDRNYGAFLGVICSSMKKRQSVNYALKSERLLHFLERLTAIKNSIKYSNGIGINLETINDILSQSTVQIIACT